MTYDPTTPASNEFQSVSQPKMLTNFSELNTLFDVDHVKYNDGVAANRGKHKKSTYVEQASDPATAASEMSVYSKDASGATQLFYRNENSGTVNQMTYPYTKAQDGTFVLPGGIRMCWGRGTIAGAASTVSVNFATPFGSTPYSITLTPYDNPITGTTPREMGVQKASIAASSFTAESFNGVVPAGGVEFGYFAIGPV